MSKKVEKKAKSKKKIIAIVLVVLIILGSGGAFAANALGFNVLPSNPLAGEKQKRMETKSKLNTEAIGDKLNILIFGIDKNKKRSKTATIFRPDTIMLATVDLKKKTITLVSTPRDSRVDISGTSGRDKINSCFYYASQKLSASELKNQDAVNKAGISCLKKTVSNVLGGVKINYYLGIDMDVLPKMADVLGGVDIYVHQNLYAKEGHDTSSIKITKGKHHLNGKQLLYYSRYRMYAMGDIGRVAVQQKVMKAIFNQFKKSASFSKIPQIYSLVEDMIETDMDMGEIASLAYSFKNFDVDDLKTYTLPGNFGNLNGVSYWIVNQSKRVTFIKKIYGIDATKLSQDARSD